MSIAQTIDPEVITAEETQPLILKGSGYGLAIAASYQDKKRELLKDSELIVSIADPSSDAAADNQLKKLAAMRIEVEKARVDVKKPALNFGKSVDATANTFSAEIEAEESRLKKLRGDYACAVLAERNRLLREMEAKHEAEEKARREAEEAQRKANEAAEKARREAEEASFNAVSPEEEAAAAKATAEASAAELVRLAAAAQVVMKPETPTFIPEAPKGVKMIADFDVVDLDLLYRGDCSLVKMEPKRAEILEKIARLKVGEDLPSIPGLRVFMRPQVR